ncbi:hypothetical protein H0H92_003422, partial [Tricholoma furcatifolium]
PYANLDIERIVKDMKHQELKVNAEREIRRRKTKNYSAKIEKAVDPKLRHAVSLAWPLAEKRKMPLSVSPEFFLHFDILSNPTGMLSSTEVQDGLFVMMKGERGTRDALELILQQSFSPDFEFRRLEIRCNELVGLGIKLGGIDDWDVIIERPHTIRVIDVFQEIFNFYQNNVTFEEACENRTLLISDECFLTAKRRRELASETHYNKDMCRVDLLGRKTIFNGFFFDPEFNQYHFQLRDRLPNGSWEVAAFN